MCVFVLSLSNFLLLFAHPNQPQSERCTKSDNVSVPENTQVHLIHRILQLPPPPLPLPPSLLPSGALFFGCFPGLGCLGCLGGPPWLVWALACLVFVSGGLGSSCSLGENKTKRWMLGQKWQSLTPASLWEQYMQCTVLAARRASTGPAFTRPYVFPLWPLLLVITNLSPMLESLQE